MKDLHLSPTESRFADIIWEENGIASGELAKKAEEALGWKRTTSYTVLKRLCERGIFENKGGEVNPLISREDFYAMQSEKVVEESFSGSLPAFVAAFAGRKKLSDKEIDELQRLIDGMRG